MLTDGQPHAQADRRLSLSARLVGWPTAELAIAQGVSANQGNATAGNSWVLSSVFAVVMANEATQVL